MFKNVGVCKIIQTLIAYQVDMWGHCATTNWSHLSQSPRWWKDIFYLIYPFIRHIMTLGRPPFHDSKKKSWWNHGLFCEVKVTNFCVICSQNGTHGIQSSVIEAYFRLHVTAIKKLRYAFVLRCFYRLLNFGPLPY